MFTAHPRTTFQGKCPPPTDKPSTSEKLPEVCCSDGYSTLCWSYNYLISILWIWPLNKVIFTYSTSPKSETQVPAGWFAKKYTLSDQLIALPYKERWWGWRYEKKILKKEEREGGWRKRCTHITGNQTCDLWNASSLDSSRHPFVDSRPTWYIMVILFYFHA